jgi:hypothetical protein
MDSNDTNCVDMGFIYIPCDCGIAFSAVCGNGGRWEPFIV